MNFQPITARPSLTAPKGASPIEIQPEPMTLDLPWYLRLVRGRLGNVGAQVIRWLWRQMRPIIEGHVPIYVLAMLDSVVEQIADQIERGL